jgi:glycosyltransferase involved in cell wall biosynthesis
MSRIAVLFGPLCLSFRKSFDFDNIRNDPRGLSGSEQGFLRIAEELQAMGHEVDVCPHGAEPRMWRGMRVMPRPEGRYDAAVSINEPDILRGVDAAFRVCMFWLNDFSFCKVGFHEHVDLFCAPSAPHLEQVMTNEAWQRVETDWEHQEGRERYIADPSKWCVVPLGCDPERYAGFSKVPGRVIYCSSPDRGLHNLLQEWAAIKRAAPHANLRIFYRLRDWVSTMKAQVQPDGFIHPAVFKNVERALYIDEALYRMSDPKWGIEVHDSVSRAQIEREQAEAQVLAFPCDPLNSFTEGFSVAVLESCAARACPITTDADAFKGLYGPALPLTPRVGDWVPAWRDNVIRALADESFREETNDRAETFARQLTWKSTAEKLMAEIENRR